MTIGRNAPCPCGSGRRYKECCGAIGAPVGQRKTPGAPASLGATMVGALAAQKASDFRTAEQLYRQALALEPDNIDALHMLGVVLFSCKRVDEAESLIRRAAALCPKPNPDINHNLLMLKELRAGLPLAPGLPLRAIRESQLHGEAADLVELAAASPLTLPAICLPTATAPAPPVPFTFPPLRLFTLRNAVVDAESEVPANDRVAVFPDLLDFARHLPSELHFKNLAIDPAYASATLFPRPADDHNGGLADAVALTSSHWSNWAHFLTEQLPKVVIADSHAPWRDRPFLISTMGLANAQDLLQQMITPGRRVIRAHGRLTLPRAGYVSTVGYCPFEYLTADRSQPPAIRATDAVFSPYALDLVRQRAHRVVGWESGRAGRARVYLKRNSKLRRIVNAQEVEACFVRHGFALLAPETLPIAGQIRLFADAQVIAGQAGAAFANMVFAPPGARLLALAAFTPHSNFHYFPNMAYALGHRLEYLFCEPRGDPHHPAHADLYVDLTRLDAALENLLSR